LDLHTRKIVGWWMRETLHTEIASEALTMAIVRQRPPPGLIHHSDPGTQPGLKWPSLIGWPSRDPALHLDEPQRRLVDNAPMGSFFHSIKTNGFTIGFMAPAPRPAETSSNISRVSTVLAACIRPGLHQPSFL